ncbi:MAG: type II secretion system protein [Pirellulales bacterium]
MSMHHRQRRGGFSWVELLAIVTILGIIAAIVVPRLTISKEAALQRVDHRNKSEINAAVERWYVEKGVWPQDDLKDIAADAAYFPHGLPSRPADGGTYSLNPTTHRVD